MSLIPTAADAHALADAAHADAPTGAAPADAPDGAAHADAPDGAADHWGDATVTPGSPATAPGTPPTAHDVVFDLTLPLSESPEGYRAMDERRAIKVLLQP